MDRSTSRDFLTPQQLADKYPAFSMRWLRHELARRRENGMSHAVRKIGGRIFVSEQRFFEWVESYKDVE